MYHRTLEFDLIQFPESLDQSKMITIEQALMNGCDGCEACPFTISEYSEQIQNYGCLPTNVEVLDMARKSGRPWGCHNDETKVCRGYASVAKSLGLPLDGEPLSYSRWYHTGKF